VVGVIETFSMLHFPKKPKIEGDTTNIWTRHFLYKHIALSLLRTVSADLHKNRHCVTFCRSPCTAMSWPKTFLLSGIIERPESAARWRGSPCCFFVGRILMMRCLQGETWGLLSFNHCKCSGIQNLFLDAEIDSPPAIN